MFGLIALSAGVGIAGCSALADCGEREAEAPPVAHERRALHRGRLILSRPVRRIPEPLRTLPFRLIPFVVLLTMVYWLWRHRKRTAAQAH